MSTAGASPNVPPKPRRRRRWWVYGLWGVGTLFVLGVSVFVGLILYWNHLIKVYTSAQAKPVPVVEVDEAKFEELKQRWEPYALLFLGSQEIPPFELTADDLNLFVSRMGPMRGQIYVELQGDGRVRVPFSVPLDRSGNPKLAGRFLNGVAMLKVDLRRGRVSARIERLEANGKPVPGWILRRLQQVNWAERLNWRPEFDMVVRGLDRLEITPGILILHPRPRGAVSR